MPTQRIMGDQIKLPRKDVSAIIKQELETGDKEHDTKGNEILQQLVQKLLDPQDDLTTCVEEIVISSIRFRDYLEMRPDGDGNMEILPSVLDAVTLGSILTNVGRNLRTFT